VSDVTAITIGGRPFDLGAVEYELTIQRGAANTWDAPAASYCSLFVRTAQAVDFEVLQAGQPMLVYRGGALRFTGTISDVSVTHPVGKAIARVSVRAMGNVSKLGSIFVGSGSWPAENAALRASRIISEAGLEPDLNLDNGQDVTARAAGSQAALGLLSDLAQGCGASVFDDEAGRIVFQAYRNRINPAASRMWGSYTTTWSATTGTWADQTYANASTPAPVTLPAQGVVYEPQMSQQSAAIVNSVQVSYGTSSPQATITATDANSISAYGTRRVTVTTNLSDSSDATDRAAAVLNAQSFPRWQIGNVDVRLDDLDAPTVASVEAIKIGDRVLLTDIPQPSPVYSQLGVVEGYTETFRPNQHRIVFSLSDPRSSFGTAAWSAISGTKTWGAVNAARKWFDIVNASDVN